MKFKLFGTEVTVSFLFSALLTAMLLFDRTGLLPPLLLAVLLHEVGHLFAMWVLECAPKRIRLIPAAIEITAPPHMSAGQEVIVAVSGPLVNGALFLAFYLNYTVFQSELSATYAAVNLLLMLFNLLPVTGLDGGTVAFCLLSRRLPLEHARLVMKVTNLLFAVTALVLGVCLWFQGNCNPSFWIVGIYLILISFMKI